MDFKNIFGLIPEVKSPSEKKLSFNVKLKWTLIVLGAFFILANITLFGLSAAAIERFEYLAIILGTDFGSIISLGIGPIVMGSIILQLLTGAGIIRLDLNTHEGKKFFQGLQKILVMFFIVFEALVYVLMNGLQPMPGFGAIVIAQLILGGLAIYYMNEVSEKWGFGSGVSLFIAAGVSWRLITQAFQFIDVQGKNCLMNFSTTACSGKVLVLIQSIIQKYPTEFLSAAAALVVTTLIFLAIVWAQSLKVEIPLSYGRIRGYGVKWPLSFFYSSVIPVIFAAALVANVQLFGGILENWLGHPTFLGHFIDGQAVSGLAFWLHSTNILELIIRGGFLPVYLLQGVIHIVVFMALCTIFSIFWVKTSGMDSKAQAEKISSSGLQVAGFRQDNRILESILDRYIMPLTVMGGAAIGLLAALTDLMGALVGGTAILLVIMIMYQFYQSIAQQHMTDMNPAMRKFMAAN
ncbi:MAG: preprotein translocase subunit SecY [Nanoarchaeota archaeon]|nr:preprotein translocase subunit SecY [Nanoarchaeota archaeon]